MAQTVGCSDFNQRCAFRITADEGQEDMMVDVATAHALKYHRSFAPTEADFRAAIQSQIKSLLTQAHVSPSDMRDFIN